MAGVCSSKKQLRKFLTFVPKRGTYVPNMSTTSGNDPISAALFGKARRGVLALLMSHADKEFYLRQVARYTGLGLGSVQRELKRLLGAGIVNRVRRGRQVFFQANTESPVFDELKSLMVKTVGVCEVLRASLSKLKDRITCAFVYGSVANGTESCDSDLDLMVIGRVTSSEVISALLDGQEKLSREINPTVYPIEEFAAKVKGGHHFIKDVVAGEKAFVIGGEREFAGLGQ